MIEPRTTPIETAPRRTRRRGATRALLAAILAIAAGCVAARTPPAGDAMFMLRSPAVVDGGQLPKDYTGDGTSSTLPLEWSGAPEGTKSFAVVMHHVAPDKLKWYWILYDIPGDATGLPKNVREVGTLGTNNTTGKTEYAPPHSNGPGPKTYIYTVYALSAPPRIDVPPEKVGRDELLAAMQGLVLGSAELRVVYTRFPVADGGRDVEGGSPALPR